MPASTQWFGLKRAIKGVVGYIPGYNASMRLFSRVLPEKAWIRRIPIANQDVQVFVAGHRLWMVRPDRCEIAKQLFWSHGTRAPKEDAIALELFARFSVDASLVLDIGSNTGLLSLVAAKANPEANVIGFDILPEAVELFFANVVRNDCCSVLPVLRGIGKAGGRFNAPANVGGSTLPSSLSTESRFESGVSVPIIALDELLAIDPGQGGVLIKIDVEATEHEIFENGAAFLAQRKPVMVCELLRRAQPGRFEQLLRAQGYHFHLITDAGLVAKQALEPHPRFKDWLFTHEVLPDGFGAQS